MWIKIKNKKPPEKDTIIAYDKVGKSIGTFDGYSFYSFTGRYSWDNSYSKNSYIGIREGSEEIVGKITHWMPLPLPPKK